ncbi:flavin-containing monooxygenase [Kineococcus rhizosphaerae]|uniref:Cation diffusion facilitator CzcD-associated flavoprotein CzcO n=1 Tax=Kineococcus rhizosphaerae TaxID=559628 RepID=A0A2T0R0S7_9ACTN|nr:NAD(P)/FAD-dependent oxidoreductase [Kineococcus rhizosphaerae]PRY12893.1 cation diffusion facilitator CzcD-associated flavoprotein CzcO [Kineococcus rhizosphaerae]
MNDRELPGAVVDVAVVGAGFAGLGAAIRLHRRGRESFVVLERAGEVGGTWRDNTYPGVACDVPSHLYSFSFAPEPGWSRVFAPGAEIQRYLRERAREVAGHVRLGCEVLRARWSGRCWELETSRGPVRARVLVLAAGRLTEPRIPDVEGLPEFGGPVFHTSRWDHSVDLAGARVGVVGTGASAVQVVPELAGTAAHVSVFQRSAPWVVPRGDRPFGADERAGFAAEPARAAALRERTFTDMERGLGARRLEPVALEALRRRASDHLEAQIEDPGLRAALRPDYEIGCKRVLLSDTFYPALTRPDVTLVPSAVRSVASGSVTAADGSRHALDVLVLATGFHSTVQPYASRVLGRDGVPLARAWERGMVSHASTVVHGFPNLFVLDGPNASLGHNSAVHVIESQVGYLLGALDHLAARGGALEVSLSAQRAYTAEIDARAAESVWLRGGCESWYVDARSGRLTLLWPDTATEFRRRNGTFDPAPFL